jgi:hypothetical protein
MQKLDTYTHNGVIYNTFDNVDNISVSIYCDGYVMDKEGFETSSDAIFWAEEFIDNLI